MVTDTNTTGARSSGERMARAVGESVSASASDLGAQAQGKMSGLLRGQMEAGADYAHMVSDTAHSFANDLESKAPELARYMHRAAERVDQFADDFRHRSPEEIINVATDYARHNPRVFFGGAIALGFVLSRFLKSGSDHSRAYSSSTSQPTGGRMGGSMSGGSMSGGSVSGGSMSGGAASGASASSSRREFGQQARDDTSREDFSNAR